MENAEITEKVRTAEELAMIHAAMMVSWITFSGGLQVSWLTRSQEELGTGRKDALPLEDKGYKGPIQGLKPLRQPNTNNANDPGAAWRNAVFDDIDPALEDLDTIADGRTYNISWTQF